MLEVIYKVTTNLCFLLCLFFLHTTDSFPLGGRMARSKFVESFNLAQNGSSVDDDPEVLASNGYGIFSFG